MTQNDKRLHQKQLGELAGQEQPLQVRIEPQDSTLKTFVIAVEGEGQSGTLRSQRKAERTFSAQAALRYTRDQLGKTEVNVKLTPKGTTE